MFNQCQFIGNLGGTPDIRAMQDGKRVANFSIACTEKWKSKDGEAKEKTEWIPVVCFGDGLVNVIEKYIHKGSKVFVQGKFSTRRWTDKEGKDRFSTEVVVSGFGGTITMLDSPNTQSGQREAPQRQDTASQPSFSEELDDVVPF